MNNKFFYFVLTLFLVMLVGLLVSCDNVPNHRKGADGYYFEKESFTRTDFPVEIVLVKSSAEMSKLIATKKNVQGTIEPKNVAAFSTIRIHDPKCTIYMLDPKIQYEPEFIGHELVHCIYGVWHREPQS